MLADKHRADFLLDFENHTFCNHGSYGAAPKVWTDFRTMKTCSFIPHWCLKFRYFRWYAIEKMNYWWKWKVILIRGLGRVLYFCRTNFQNSDFYTIRCRKNPLRKTALPRYIECCKAAADFVYAAHDNLTIVRNTTQGWGIKESVTEH